MSGIRILLESMHLDDISWGVRTGLIDGVLTNPTLMETDTSERQYRARLVEICQLVRGPVMADLSAVDAEGMYREGRELARGAENIVVNIPMIEEGLQAAHRLADDGVPVNITLVFSASQALFAAKTGAAYVSASLGALEDLGDRAAVVLHDVRELFDAYRVECELIASCVRTPPQFLEAARVGVDAAGVPVEVLRAMLVHPLTDRGLDRLLQDWSHRIARARAEA